ncbi:MAG: hypothetical protein QM765_50090 [Myxococcales bacterium]
MRILVVDDTPGLAESLANVLRLHPEYTTVITAETYESARRAALAEPIDLAILDENLGADSKTGSELARRSPPGGASNANSNTHL